jgi:hypothetical protein
VLNNWKRTELASVATRRSAATVALLERCRHSPSSSECTYWLTLDVSVDVNYSLTESAADPWRENYGSCSPHCAVAARISRKGLSPIGLRPNEWPLTGGLVGGKFGGINLGRSRLVLLLRTVEFEDAVDQDRGDPMLEGCRAFFVPYSFSYSR